MQALLCAMHKIRLKFRNSKVSSGTDVHGRNFAFDFLLCDIQNTLIF